jgi:hypothetical protein
MEEVIQVTKMGQNMLYGGQNTVTRAAGITFHGLEWPKRLNIRPEKSE